MENMLIVYMTMLMILSSGFGVFILGFLIGFKREDKLIKNKRSKNELVAETDKEKKAKKDWKNFLEYDGSAPNDIV